MRLFGRKNKRSDEPRPDKDDALDRLWENDAAREPDEEMPTHQLAAWSLVLRSPYSAWRGATSWLGGRPVVPIEFEWPRGEDGRPLAFLGQINFSHIGWEPTTGARPAGIPESGALLFFIGETVQLRVISRREFSQSGPIVPPEDHPELADYGFETQGKSFRYWPVDPEAYLDPAGGRPAFMPDRFARPEDWITNWGLAAVEAGIAIEGLTRELKSAEDYRQELSALSAWAQRAISEPPNAPINVEELTAAFKPRQDLAARMEKEEVRRLLTGAPEQVWHRLELKFNGLNSPPDFADVPDALRGFVEAWVARWRGHRMFGSGPPAEYCAPEVSDMTCLAAFGADDVIETVGETLVGLSVWCPREELANGDFSGAVLLHHHLA